MLFPNDIWERNFIYSQNEVLGQKQTCSKLLTLWKAQSVKSLFFSL